MSKLSIQCDGLRETANCLDEIGISMGHDTTASAFIAHDISERMRNAADTIEKLRDMLQYYIDNKSRWYELFGTPERAARTLEKAELEVWDYCEMVGSRCDECRYEFDRYGCCDPTPLIEWLRGDA